MKFTYTDSINDTLMFLLGLLLGILINILFRFLMDYFKCKYEEMYCAGILGILQIFVNAFVMNIVKNKVDKLGLFYLGLFSAQYLIIKDIYLWLK